MFLKYTMHPLTSTSNDIGCRLVFQHLKQFFVAHYAGEVIFHSFFVQILAQFFVIFHHRRRLFFQFLGGDFYFFLFRYLVKNKAVFYSFYRVFFPIFLQFFFRFFGVFQIVVPFQARLSDVSFHLFGHFVFFLFHQKFRHILLDFFRRFFQNFHSSSFFFLYFIFFGNFFFFCHYFFVDAFIVGESILRQNGSCHLKSKGIIFG